LFHFLIAEFPKKNIVAACNLCNPIKGDKVFKTLKEAQCFINVSKKWKEIIFYEEEKMSSMLY